jgi:hypothetical protein
MGRGDAHVPGAERRWAMAGSPDVSASNAAEHAVTGVAAREPLAVLLMAFLILKPF